MTPHTGAGPLNYHLRPEEKMEIGVKQNEAMGQRLDPSCGCGKNKDHFDFYWPMQEARARPRERGGNRATCLDTPLFFSMQRRI